MLCCLSNIQHALFDACASPRRSQLPADIPDSVHTVSRWMSSPSSSRSMRGLRCSRSRAPMHLWAEPPRCGRSVGLTGITSLWVWGIRDWTSSAASSTTPISQSPSRHRYTTSYNTSSPEGDGSWVSSALGSSPYTRCLAVCSQYNSDLGGNFRMFSSTGHRKIRE